MAPSLTAKVEVTVSDRDLNEAKVTFNVPFSTPLATLIAAAPAFCSLVASLSDGVIKGYRLRWSTKIDDPGTAPFGVDLNRLAVLYYRNDDGYEAIWIPSGAPELTETTGEYEGIRLDASLPAVQTALDLWQTAISGQVTKEADGFPEDYVVGGLAQ